MDFTLSFLCKDVAHEVADLVGNFTCNDSVSFQLLQLNLDSAHYF